MTPALRTVLLNQRFNPATLANNAAWYSLDGAEGDTTYLTNGSGRLKLVADRSGNSSVNNLVLNGAAGNYASFSALTAFGTGDFSVSAKVMIWNFTTANCSIIGGAANSFGLRVDGTGALLAALNNVGTLGPSSSTLSLFQVATIGYTRSGTTGTFYIEGSAVGTVSDSRNYSVGVSEIGSVFAGTSLNTRGNIATARVYSVALSGAQMLADAGGTIQSNCLLDIDCSAPAKLASSFSSGARGGASSTTVTVNSSGDLGARICGARDIYQATTTKMPAIAAASDGRTTATFDGTNDYLQASAFSLSQPESRYFVGSQGTWTTGDAIYDGTVTSSSLLLQETTTPRIKINSGTASVADNDGLTVGNRAIVTCVFNGASSLIRVNIGTATTGNPGTRASNGVTVGTAANATVAGNIGFNELLVRASADDTSTQSRIQFYEISKWGIAA